MNKAKKILNITEVYSDYDRKSLVTELYTADKALSSWWMDISKKIKSTAAVLETPITSENADQVIESLGDLNDIISKFEGRLSTLEIRIMDVRGELQDKQDRGEL